MIPSYKYHKLWLVDSNKANHSFLTLMIRGLYRVRRYKLNLVPSSNILFTIKLRRTSSPWSWILPMISGWFVPPNSRKIFVSELVIWSVHTTAEDLTFACFCKMPSFIQRVRICLSLLESSENCFEINSTMSSSESGCLSFQSAASCPNWRSSSSSSSFQTPER